MDRSNKNNSGIYIRGAMLGIVVGIVSAHFYAKALDENGDDRKEEKGFSIGDMARFGLLLLSIVRQIVEFGSKSREPEES